MVVICLQWDWNCPGFKEGKMNKLESGAYFPLGVQMVIFSPIEHHIVIVWDSRRCWMMDWKRTSSDEFKVYCVHLIGSSGLLARELALNGAMWLAGPSFIEASNMHLSCNGLERRVWEEGPWFGVGIESFVMIWSCCLKVFESAFKALTICLVSWRSYVLMNHTKGTWIDRRLHLVMCVHVLQPANVRRTNKRSPATILLWLQWQP